MRKLCVKCWEKDGPKKYEIYINGVKKGELGPFSECIVEIPTQSSKLTIVPSSMQGATVMIPDGENDLIAHVRIPLFNLKSTFLYITFAEYPVKEPLEGDSLAHFDYINDLVFDYFETGSETIGDELQELYKVTEKYYQQNIDQYDIVRALHACSLALRYINEPHFIPSKASYYVDIAQSFFEDWLHSSNIDDQKMAEFFLFRVYEVRAVLGYFSSDNIERIKCQDWIEKAKEIGEIDNNCIGYLDAILLYWHTSPLKSEDQITINRMFEHLKKMDATFDEPVIFPFEENILCEAYSIYKLFYTDEKYAQCVSIPLNPKYAAHMLERARDLIKNPHLKSMLQVDIDRALFKAGDHSISMEETDDNFRTEFRYENNKKHANWVKNQAIQYFETISNEIGDELEINFKKTLDRLKDDHEFDEIIALHAHTLTIRAMNSHDTERAKFYIKYALDYYDFNSTSYLEKENLVPSKYQIWEIMAYIEYLDENYNETLYWLKKLELAGVSESVTHVALKATAMNLVAVQSMNKEMLKESLLLFEKMDTMFTEPVHFKFEESILCLAYCYYGHVKASEKLYIIISTPYPPMIARTSAQILVRARNLMNHSLNKDEMDVEIKELLAMNSPIIY